MGRGAAGVMFFKIVHEKLDKIVRLLERQRKATRKMSQELNELKAKVEAQTNVNQSAITLLQELHTMLEQNADDPAAIRDLAAKLAGSTASLAAAVTANTPAEPPAPAPEPAPEPAPTG